MWFKRKKKDKENSLSARRVASNTWFALKVVWTATPLYLIMYFFCTIIWGILGFLGETYVLRMVVNTAQTAQGIDSTIRFVVILGVTAIVVNTCLR